MSRFWTIFKKKVFKTFAVPFSVLMISSFSIKVILIIFLDSIGLTFSKMSCYRRFFYLVIWNWIPLIIKIPHFWSNHLEWSCFHVQTYNRDQRIIKHNFGLVQLYIITVLTKISTEYLKDIYVMFKLFSLPDFAKIMPSVSSLMIKISHLICIILPQGPKSSGLSPNPLWETLMGQGVIIL